MKLPISSQRRLARRPPRDCHYRPNARFWVWITSAGDPDAFVRITLRPGQELNWTRGSRTDEGWHREYVTFEHVEHDETNVPSMECERLFGQVRWNELSRGADCDGGYSHETEVFCSVEELAACFVGGDSFALGRAYRVPNWKQNQSRCRQRDYSAERAGY